MESSERPSVAIGDNARSLSVSVMPNPVDGVLIAMGFGQERLFMVADLEQFELLVLGMNRIRSYLLGQRMADDL